MSPSEEAKKHIYIFMAHVYRRILIVIRVYLFFSHRTTACVYQPLKLVTPRKFSRVVLGNNKTRTPTRTRLCYFGKSSLLPKKNLPHRTRKRKGEKSLQRSTHEARETTHEKLYFPRSAFSLLRAM